MKQLRGNINYSKKVHYILHLAKGLVNLAYFWAGMCCLDIVISIVSDCNNHESFSFSLVRIQYKSFRLATLFNLLREEVVFTGDRAQKKGKSSSEPGIYIPIYYIMLPNLNEDDTSGH